MALARDPGPATAAPKKGGKGAKTAGADPSFILGEVFDMAATESLKGSTAATGKEHASLLISLQVLFRKHCILMTFRIFLG